MKICCAKSLHVGFLTVLTVAGAAGAGFWAGRLGDRATAESAPLLSIDATGSAIGEEFSLATGPVSDDAEGVFVLDHATGLLQCNVLYPRTSQFGAAFQVNVKESLPGGGKNSKYLMVTGAARFGASSNRGGGNCVVYVLDQSSGAYACYGVPFNPSAVNSRTPQMGMLVPLAVGQARQALDRDALR
ncbi:hypothetical protein [Candidatus Laterigemmans baculatus]|uniref:hypothetical protein n=1 Tax=Candidatus Laterigemmans baculatus TaxID=2770505 RepID=UPI0013DB2605|nr:hypothetical protein [Candidatus Laterigemmans baculatus]